MGEIENKGDQKIRRSEDQKIWKRRNEEMKK
jgi:hypothetical protein